MDLTIILIIGIVGIVILVLFFIITYNGLVGKKNQVTNAFSSIDVQLKQRHDLIPNLIAAVKASMSHERGTLEKIVELRSQAMKPNLPQSDKIQLENEITKNLSGIMVAIENYPQLKANDSIRDLQKSLNETEAQIAASRRSFNASVTEYNNALEMFPSNIVAGFLRYQKESVFVSSEEERKNVDVAKLFNT